MAKVYVFSQKTGQIFRQRQDKNIVAAFQGMCVSLVKHSYA